MEKLFKAAAAALLLANLAWPLGRWAQDRHVEESSPQVRPELLALAGPGQPNSRSSSAAGPLAACVKLSGLGPGQAPSAIAALGGASGAKEFKQEPRQVWWAVWGGSVGESEAQGKARELAQAAGRDVEPWRFAKGWGARLGPFGTQAEAAAAGRGLGLSTAKDAWDPGSEVRFGPWPKDGMQALAEAAKGWGRVKVDECSQKEAEEWEGAK